MDPIFDRLGRLIRSNNPFRSGSGSGPSLSADEQAAFDELEAELNGSPKPSPSAGQSQRSYQEQRRQETPRPAPPSLDPKVAQAYARLEVPPGADWEAINAAHRSLLKKHHPDRHAGNEAKMKQATAESQKINEAFQVLKKHLGR